MSRKYTLLLSVLWLTTLAVAQENEWEQKTSFYIDRERSASFSIGGIGYLCAGLDTILRNDLWQYDQLTDAWTQLADLPGVPRRNAVAFAVNGRGYVGTGHDSEYSNAGTPLDDFWEFDPVLNNWTQKADYPGAGGTGVYFATGFATTNYGYVACGKKATSNYEQDLWRYNPVNDTWLQRANFPGGDRYCLMSFVISDIAYVGFGSDMDLFRKDLWAYDEVSNTWEQKADCNGAPRASGGTFTLNGRGFICCGADGGFKEDLWEYDPLVDQWKIRAYFPVNGRRYGISFSLNDKGYFGCGKGSFGQKRSLFEYTPMSVFGWMMEEAGLTEMENKQIRVFPNPAMDFINAEWNEELSVDHVILLDMQGKALLNQTTGGTNIQLNLKNLQAGQYILGLYDEKNVRVATQKIIRE